MENDIQNAISKASPISAYGINKLPQGPRILRMIGYIFLIFCIVGILCIFLIQIPVPEKTIALGFIKSGTKLSEKLPLSWRESIEPSFFPIIIGLSSKEEQYEPFAIIPRIQPTSGLHRQNFGFFSLISANPISQTTKKLYTFLPLLWNLRHSPSAFSLSLPVEKEQNLTFVVTGPFEGHVWKSTIPLPITEQNKLPEYANAVNLAVFPEADQLIQTKLQKLFNLPPEKIKMIAWESQNDALKSFELEFNKTDVPTTSAIAFLGAFGVQDQVKLNLADGTVIDEYRLPTNIFTSASSTTKWQTGSSTTVSIHGASITYTTNEKLQTSIPTCPGTPVFRFNQQSLEQIAKELQFSIYQSPTYLTGSIMDNKLILCVD
ncbi:hypothetical protein IT408_03100 [Candidatus Uhrbacteria bacterium]|nr:hypothetical protein [Candidatus Uhrbacteria bacterium]